MEAVPILSQKRNISITEFIELVIWQVPSPVPPSEHDFKYRLVHIRDGERIVGYDNDARQGRP